MQLRRATSAGPPCEILVHLHFFFHFISSESCPSSGPTHYRGLWDQKLNVSSMNPGDHLRGPQSWMNPGPRTACNIWTTQFVKLAVIYGIITTLLRINYGQLSGDLRGGAEGVLWNLFYRTFVEAVFELRSALIKLKMDKAVQNPTFWIESLASLKGNFNVSKHAFSCQLSGDTHQLALKASFISSLKPLPLRFPVRKGPPGTNKSHHPAPKSLEFMFLVMPHGQWSGNWALAAKRLIFNLG